MRLSGNRWSLAVNSVNYVCRVSLVLSALWCRRRFNFRYLISSRLLSNRSLAAGVSHLSDFDLDFQFGFELRLRSPEAAIEWLTSWELWQHRVYNTCMPICIVHTNTNVHIEGWLHWTLDSDCSPLFHASNEFLDLGVRELQLTCMKSWWRPLRVNALEVKSHRDEGRNVGRCKPLEPKNNIISEWNSVPTFVAD